MINNKSLNYWGKISKNLITWHKPFKNIFNNDNFLWFEDGKLNLYENLILRNSKDKIAITCIEKNNKIKSFTFGQVHELVLILESNLEYHLKNKNNLRVMIQASASIESAVSMLMCMKNGFHFCVLFEDLELAAIEKRIKLFKPNIYLARNQKGSKIKQKGVKVIKKISIRNKSDLNAINDFDNADFFLFDYKPDNGDLPGGNAKQFDWGIIKDLKINKPWFLSGGINLGNIQTIKRQFNPYGIDLSSGVEKELGIKDNDIINNFIDKLNYA